MMMTTTGHARTRSDLVSGDYARNLVAVWSLFADLFPQLADLVERLDVVDSEDEQKRVSCRDR